MRRFAIFSDERNLCSSQNLIQKPGILHPGKFYDSPSREERLIRILRMVHDLRRDDQAMRCLAPFPLDERAKAFNQARRNHGPRHEFAAYHIDLPFNSLSLHGALAAMEFQIDL